MKKTNIAILMAMVLLCSCSGKDSLTDASITTDEVTIDQDLSFSGKIAEEYDIQNEESLDADDSSTVPTTRAAFNPTNMLGTWDVGDRVHINDGMLSCVYKVEKGGDVSCAFKVSSSENMFTNANAENTFYAFYPATAVSGWYDGTVTAVIYGEQDYAENMPGDAQRFGGYYVSGATIGNNGNVSFAFDIMASIVDIDISAIGVTPESVSIKSNSGVSLSGKFSYDCTSDKQTIAVKNNDNTDYTYSTQSDVVTISDIPSDATYVRFYVLPVQLAGGLTITVKDTDGNYYTKVSSKDIGTVDGAAISISGVNGASACKPYYKKINFGNLSNVTRKNNWMACVPSNIKFSLMSTPGAHDAATSNCGSASKCQSETIGQLLTNGVRALDIRPRYTSNKANDIQLENLEIYHGSSATGVKFKDAMATIVQFVKDNPSEAVSLLIQKENSKLLFSLTDQSETWRASLRECFEGYKDYLRGWIKGDEKLSDMRGKIIIVSKNPYGNSSNNYWDVVYGGIVRDWPDDNETTAASIYYSWNQGGPSVSASDYYSLTNTDKKMNYVSSMLSEAQKDNTNRYYYTFVSMAWSITTSPSTYANTMNTNVTNYINSLTGRLGYVYGDFMGSSSYNGKKILKAIIDQNFKYVYQNRSRKMLKHSNPGVIDVIGDEFAKGDGEVYSRQR